MLRHSNLISFIGFSLSGFQFSVGRCERRLLAVRVYSEGVIYVLEVEGARSITKACESTLLTDIESKAIALHSVELLDILTSAHVVALCADSCVTAASEHKVLPWDEAHTVHHWVDKVTALSHFPDQFIHGTGQVTEVPKLDALTQSASTGHAVVVIVRDVNAIATD